MGLCFFSTSSVSCPQYEGIEKRPGENMTFGKTSGLDKIQYEIAMMTG